MAESYLDTSFECATPSSDMLRPRSPAAPTLRIVAPEPGRRGKPKNAAELIKHHLSVYERITADLNPADIKQMLELGDAILQDARDLMADAQQTRSAMLASILGLSPQALSGAHLEKLI